MNRKHPEFQRRMEMIRELWPQGLPASAIAERIGNCTRSAVIALARRMGMASRPSPIKRLPPMTIEERIKHRRERQRAYDATMRRRKKGKPAQPAQPRVRIGIGADIPVLGVSEPGNGCCHYPLWGNEHKPVRRFCGLPGAPWCAAHRAIVYRPAVPGLERMARAA